MKTLKVDQKQRIRLPNGKPHTVYAYIEADGGVIVLSPVKPQQRKELFPRGYFLKYMTPERDKLMAQLAAGCVQGPE